MHLVLKIIVMVWVRERENFSCTKDIRSFSLFFKLDIVHIMLPLHPLKLTKVDP